MSYARPHDPDVPIRGARDDRTAPRTATAALRAFQVLAALAGALLFVLGLVAIFEVEWGDAWLRTTADAAGYGFSAAGALAALVLGAAILIAALADEDRASAAVIGLVTLGVGIVGFILRDEADADIQVETGTAALFVVLGAAVFLLSLVPWWSRRRPLR